MIKTDNAEFLKNFDVIELNEIDIIFYYYILIKPSTQNSYKFNERHRIWEKMKLK